MGQYYKFVNMDKKEVLYPDDYECFAKLMETSFFEGNTRETNGYMAAFCYLMETRWKGDQVVLIGDYADYYPNGKNENDFSGAQAMATLYKKYPKLTADIPRAKRTKATGNIVFTPYFICEDHGSSKTASLDVENYKIPRYIINEAKKSYIDLDHMPTNWSAKDKDGNEHEMKVFPLSLMIACGNGLGGGDYFGTTGQDLVGQWILDTPSIRLTNDEPDLAVYQELKPGFNIITHTIDELVETLEEVEGDEIE